MEAVTDDVWELCPICECEPDEAPECVNCDGVGLILHDCDD